MNKIKITKTKNISGAGYYLDIFVGPNRIITKVVYSDNQLELILTRLNKQLTDLTKGN